MVRKDAEEKLTVQTRCKNKMLELNFSGYGQGVGKREQLCKSLVIVGQINVSSGHKRKGRTMRDAIEFFGMLKGKGDFLGFLE